MKCPGCRVTLVVPHGHEPGCPCEGMDSSEILPGKHRFVVAGGPNLMYGERQHYASRRHTLDNPMLPAHMRDVFQVLVFVIGGLQWINISPSDLV